VRWLATLLLGLVLAGAPFAARAAEPAPWWGKAWKYRKTVRIELPRQANDIPVTFFESSKLLGERSLTGRAMILVEGGTKRADSEIVVTDASGKVVPSRSFMRRGEPRTAVLFKAAPVSATYHVYYGNPAAKRQPLPWQRSAFPVAVTMVAAPRPDAIETPGGAAQALLAAKTALRRTEAYSIRHNVNPFQLSGSGHYLTLHSGLMVARVAGTYEFSVDAGGKAHLLIDGSLVVTAEGAARPARTWRERAQVRLARGVHFLTVLHGERVAAQGIRIGWMPPGERRFAVMPGSAFARGNYVNADILGMEERGKEIVPFFTLTRSGAAFQVAGRKEAMLALELTNLTRGAGLTFVWRVGDRALTGRSPTCFVDAAKPHKIVLEVRRGVDLLGTYERSVAVRTRPRLPRVAVSAQLELLRCPTVIYEVEGATLAFKLTNPSSHPMPVRLERALGEEETSSQGFTIAAGDEEPVEMALPRLAAGAESADVTFRLWLGRAKLGEHRLRLVRPGAHLAALRPQLGHLVDADGRRIVIATDLESEDEHRRWALFKWLGRKTRTKGTNVLLYGDPMLNVGGDGAKGYVDLVRDRLVGEDRSLTFVERRTDAIVPALADIPAFAAALAKHEPDLVVLCPGASDMQKGVPRVRFARALDVLIDLARLQPNPPAVVLASPPPLVSDPEASAAGASAVRIIAGQHRLPIVDLHAIIQADPDWQDRYRGELADRVFTIYPNDETQRVMADAILKAME